MTEYDQDIEFDFFDDLETGETQAPPRESRRQRPPGPPPPPRRSDGPSIPPTARLVGLVAFAILIIVLLVLWVQSCSGTSRKTSFSNYFAKVQALAQNSTQLGASFSEALTTPGIKASQLATKLDTLAAEQARAAAQAASVKPPKALQSAHESVLEALELRFSGLRGLATALRNGAGTTQVQDAAVRLAVQAQRLVASDVIWQDRFRAAAIDVMRRQRVTGLSPPPSRFLKDTGLDNPSYWTQVLVRLNNNSSRTTGGKVGTALLGVKALPSGKSLVPGSENTVAAVNGWGFEAVVQNSGDTQLVRVNVTLTIQQPQSPITQTQQISVIDPGATKMVKFTNLGTPTFAEKTTVKVDVQVVKNETNPNNNSASYPVIFSLSG